MSEQSAGAVAGNDRIVAVLDALITGHRGQGWGVRELAEAVGLSRSTVNRILQGLTARGLARVDANSTYSGGAAATGSCQGAARPSPPAAWCTAGDGRAQPGRRRHRHARRARPAARHRVHRTAAPAGRPDPLPPRTRMELPLHAGAAGRAILSAVGVDVLGPRSRPLQRRHRRRPEPTRRGPADRPEGRLRDQRGPAHPARRRRRLPSADRARSRRVRVRHPPAARHHRRRPRTPRPHRAQDRRRDRRRSPATGPHRAPRRSVERRRHRARAHPAPSGDPRRRALRHPDRRRTRPQAERQRSHSSTSSGPPR